MDSLVLVTGATGYVAGHCVAELLDHGYSVRATVRDPAARDRYAHLTRLDGADRLEVVAADLTSDAGWADAVAGCTAVLHVASPFPARPASDDELITPAVQGTLRILRAAAAEPSVRRVVMTSSVAAITNGHAGTEPVVYTERDWSVVENSAAYAKSKTLAERAAWDFIAHQPPERRLELVALNPGAVLGPLQQPVVGTSLALVHRLLTHAAPGSPRIGFALVDVRDLATAHRLALEVPDAAGQRYVLAGEHVWMREIAAVLDEHFGRQGYRIPTRQLPDWVVRLVGRFDPSVRAVLPVLGREERVSASKAERELGWSMRSTEQTILDTADSLIDHGLATPGRAAKNAA